MTDVPGAILLVEDNLDHAELTMDAIKRSKVANPVVWVEDGESALDFLYRRAAFADRSEGNPIICLLDMKLPGIDGLSVLKAIRRDKAFAAMPVIILTTSRQESEVLAAYLNHANSYVVKPVSFDDFYKKVQELNVYWTLTNYIPTEQG
jgi:two-component system response regulator